jgi:hypothetical protein
MRLRTRETLLQVATAAAIVCTAAAIFLPAAASAEAPHLTPIQPVAWVVDSGPQNLVSSVR